MLKFRIQYTDKTEMQQAIKLIENEYKILSLVEESKKKNPKYANSKYKMAYLDIERKN